MNKKSELSQMLNLLLNSESPGIDNNVFGQCTIVHVKPDSFEFVIRKAIEYVENTDEMRCF